MENKHIYPTNYDSLYVAIISGGSDLRSGRNFCKERNGATQLLQYIPPTENNGFAQLYAYDPKHTTHKTSDEDMYLIIDYEKHIGTKLDYLFFQSSRLLQASEIQLLKNQCEQERTQILTILMLSLENPRLAGYMLTGNRSMFLETDGSLAWLFHYPLVHSPLHTMNQCYDRIPILYEGQIQFVDPITRQTNPAGNIQNCIDRIKKLFQLDMDQEDSWYTLTPGIVHQDRPAVFGPKDVSPVAVYSFPGSQDAGMYTRSELNNFRDSILISAAFRNALKKFSQKLIFFSNNNKNPDIFPYHAPRTDFVVENMISPGYFKDRFMDTFGPVASFLEHCGIYFSVFLFLKPIIDVVAMVIRHLEKTKMTGASLGFGKTLLSASYNIFLMSVLTSMFDPRAPTFATVEEERKTFCNEEELNDMRDDIKKKEEHIYPVMSPAQFNQAVTPISPVLNCFNSFPNPHYTESFLLVTIVFQSSLIQKKNSNPWRLLVWTYPLTQSSPFYILFLLLRKYLLIQRRLTRHPPHLQDLLIIPKLYFQTPLLLPQLDYSSRFRSLKTINVKLQTNFFHLVPSYLTFDPFYLGLITLNSNPINLL